MAAVKKARKTKRAPVKRKRGRPRKAKRDLKSVWFALPITETMAAGIEREAREAKRKRRDWVRLVIADAITRARMVRRARRTLGTARQGDEG